jgi:hypothetical protein
LEDRSVKRHTSVSPRVSMNKKYDLFFSVALHSLKDLGLLTYRRFLELFRYMVGLLGRVIIPSQGLYLHRATQHRKTLTNIHALSGIRTHDPSNQPAKTHGSGRTATVTSTSSSVALQSDRALASLTCFMIVIVRCGLSAPRSTWF